MTHDSHHDQVLRAVAEGALEYDEAEVTTLTRQCERCRAEVAELRKLRLAFRRSSQIRDEVLQLARAGDASSIASVFESSLRAAIAGAVQPARSEPCQPKSASPSIGNDRDAAQRNTARRFLPFGLVAAAIVLAIGLGVWTRHDQAVEKTGEVFLGESKIEIRSPTTARRFELVFVWSAELSPGSRSTLLIEGKPSDSDDWTLLRSVETSAKQWKPSAEEARQWPPVLRWRVIARTASGAVDAESPWAHMTLVE